MDCIKIDGLVMLACLMCGLLGYAIGALCAPCNRRRPPRAPLHSRTRVHSPHNKNSERRL